MRASIAYRAISAPLRRPALLDATVFLASATLAIRAWSGPISAQWVRISSPFFLEGVVVFSILAAILLNARREVAQPASTPLPELPFGAAAALIAALYAPNLASPFLSDDYILTRASWPTLTQLGQWFYTPGGDGAFRPLGYLYFAALHRVAGNDPFPWHAAGLLLHLVNCALVFLLARRLWPDARCGGLAALLFGIHGTRPEVVAWTAGSFDLLATFGILAGCAIFFSPLPRPLRWTAALLFPALGILAKESAYAWPLILLCLAVASHRLDREALAFLGAATLLCALLLAWRFVLFHGPGGYVDPASGRPQILALHAVTALKALCVRVWDILCFPLNWAMPVNGIAAGAIALGPPFLFKALPCLPMRTAAALAASVICGLLPAVHLALIGDDALGSRILYLPALGFVLLVALALSRHASRLAAAVVVCCSLVITAHNLAAWRSAAEFADHYCRAAAQSTTPTAAPPRTLNGVYLFANGFAECVESYRDTSSNRPSRSSR